MIRTHNPVCSIHELQHVAEALAELAPTGEATALATVIRVRGSSYRRPGARMLITSDRRTFGMVSGGCLEHDVSDHACLAMADGRLRAVRYDSTSKDDALFGTGLGCNGVVDVLIEPLSEEAAIQLARFVNDVVQRRQPGIIATVIGPEGQTPATLGQRFYIREETGMEAGKLDPAIARWIYEAGLNVLRSGESAMVTYKGAGTDSMEVILEHIKPPVHLVVLGTCFDALPLVRIAKELGWQTTVADVRQRADTMRRFTEADRVSLVSLEEMLASLGLDDRTVAVVMNHNVEDDTRCLQELLRYPFSYIGVLGPKKRTAQMLDQLKTEGLELTDKQRSALHAPVGLDIGAESPEEIALSIVAEIQAVLAGRNATSIRDREYPLHVDSPLSELAAT